MTITKKIIAFIWVMQILSQVNAKVPLNSPFYMVLSRWDGNSLLSNDNVSNRDRVWGDTDYFTNSTSPSGSAAVATTITGSNNDTSVTLELYSTDEESSIIDLTSEYVGPGFSVYELYFNDPPNPISISYSIALTSTDNVEYSIATCTTGPQYSVQNGGTIEAACYAGNLYSQGVTGIKKVRISVTLGNEPTVTTQEITTMGITTNEISTQDWTSSEISTQELTTSELSTQYMTTSEVSTQKITTNTVTTHKITTNAVSTHQITSGELTSQELSTASLTSSSISSLVTTNSIEEAGNNTQCVDTSDCEDQGLCLNGYCSCYSGFGGSICEDKPALVCSNEYNILNSNIARFKTEVGVSFENSVVKMIIKAPLESTMYENPTNDHSLVASNKVYSLDTTIKFVGSNNLDTNKCNYPNGLIENVYSWSKPYATDTYDDADKDCSDIYTLNLPWSTFRSRCDLQNLGNNVFGQAIEISRNYAVPFESDYITRTETLLRNIEFSFPDSVDITSNVGVLAPATISVSAILSVKYNIQNDRWIIIIITDTIRPFRLASPVVSSDSTTEDRIESVSLIQSQQSTTKQNVVIEIDSCYSLNSVLTIALTAECYVSSECSPENERYVNLTVTVNTGNACPLVHTISLSTSSLSSFSDSTLTQPQGVFSSNSLAYFTANIDSDEATITSKQLETVCISLNGGTCNNVSFNLINENDESENPSFSISLASLNGLAQDGDIVTVGVRVNIEWQDTNKRSIQTFEIALNSRFIIRTNSNNNNNIVAPTNSGISQKIPMIGLLISVLLNFI